jgi:hypothetical protein
MPLLCQTLIFIKPIGSKIMSIAMLFFNDFRLIWTISIAGIIAIGVTIASKKAEICPILCYIG